MKRVKKLRLEVGMSQYVLADLLGINQPNYTNIENEKYIPNNVKETEQRAIEILKPLLVEKILKVQEDLNRLESLMLQF